MQAKIKNRKLIATETLLVEFDLLGLEVAFVSGQFFFVKLPNLLYPDVRGGRRHFSIVNSPLTKGVLTLATRLTPALKKHYKLCR